MELGLRGKRAIITGATRGIGRSIAEHFLAEGVEITICARSEDAVAQAVSDLSAKGKVTGRAVDVSDEKSYVAWLEDAVAELGGLDIFVPNVSAGGGLDKWQAVYEMDVMGTVRGVETLLPHLRANGGGAITLISTTAAIEIFRAPTAYNAFKAALLNYAKNLSDQLAPDQVRVNSVAPGPVYFAGGAWEMIKEKMTDFYQSTLKSIPMGRMAEPADIARAVTFLSSDAARYITGTTLVVDGGMTRRVDY